ncbi:MAG: hypothetical protein JO306_04260 [Gemmatimonadetes bacterium]|nr:hypothetical protein [Gemmatimonadota bacterium]
MWFLPREARDGGDTKGRRHVLLTESRDTDDLATLAYASTRNGEAALGAAFVKVDPERTPYGRAGHTGFDRPTYVYPCRLVGSEADDLQRMTGRLIDEMPEIRSRLIQALGIGTGSCDGAGPAANSWRGRVITLADNLAEERDTLRRGRHRAALFESRPISDICSAP